jgi:hypothetical protein
MSIFVKSEKNIVIGTRHGYERSVGSVEFEGKLYNFVQPQRSPSLAQENTSLDLPLDVWKGGSLVSSLHSATDWCEVDRSMSIYLLTRNLVTVVWSENWLIDGDVFAFATASGKNYFLPLDDYRGVFGFDGDIISCVGSELCFHGTKYIDASAADFIRRLPRAIGLIEDAFRFVDADFMVYGRSTPYHGSVKSVAATYLDGVLRRPGCYSIGDRSKCAICVSKNAYAENLERRSGLPVNTDYRNEVRNASRQGSGVFGGSYIY